MPKLDGQLHADRLAGSLAILETAETSAAIVGDDASLRFTVGNSSL